MRGAFDRLCNVFHGLRSVTGPPGVQFAADVPCRIVEQREIGQRQFPFDLSTSWITLDELQLAGPNVLPPWDGATYSDYAAADVVSLTASIDDGYVVCRSERVTPVGGVPYWRYLLVPLWMLGPPTWRPLSPLPADPGPLPVPPPPPGLVCASAVPIGLGDLVAFEYAAAPPQWDRWYLLEGLTPGEEYQIFTADGGGSVIWNTYHPPCAPLSPFVPIPGGFLGFVAPSPSIIIRAQGVSAAAGAATLLAIDPF